jgi:DNA-binding IclR family transcriptional regulator
MRNRRERQGIQSVELGLRLVRVLAEAAAALTLKDLAAAASMPASKAHRYLVSLGRSELVAQDPLTGRYDLGPLALRAGLAALGRIDAAKVGAWAAAALRERSDETVLIAIWTERGPIVIRWEESSRPVTVNVRVGSVMPLLTSATGRVFLTHMPAERTRGMVASERAALTARAGAVSASRLIDEVRRQGLGRVQGDLLPGVSALAAPVFGHDGRLAFVLTALGPQGSFDARWSGRVAPLVKAVAAEASGRLGHHPNDAAG